MWEAVSSSPLSTYSVSCILQSPRQRQTADGRCAFGADVACCAAAVTHRIVLLFQEEVKKGQMVTSVIGRLANYDGGTIPNTELESVEDEVSEKGGKKKATQKVRTSLEVHHRAAWYCFHLLCIFIAALLLLYRHRLYNNVASMSAPSV